ncbi:hypothetical protein LCGC14_1621870 [marine sediment metagenome]|uniref:Uncharacterized protein n=1 Tax=marine sediment metagenome TaxID=412755 RepID=A0A0F9IS88_9ZZZZ
MLFITDPFVVNILVVFLLMALMAFNIYIYLKVRRWIVIAACFFFSIIFSIGSFEYSVPLSPYLQIFYMLISGLLFLVTTLEAYNK